MRVLSHFWLKRRMDKACSSCAGRKNYFVWQQVKMGMFAARSLLQIVDEGRGRARVSECKLIESTQ
jgi:hypothetical protein